jgi:hypothetical protein
MNEMIQWQGHLSSAPSRALLNRFLNRLQDVRIGFAHPRALAQMERDPDLEMILGAGEVWLPGEVRVRQTHGPNGRCHWNVSRLFLQGEVDSIVIGYVYTEADGWHQHTWGLNKGPVDEVIETTFGNAQALVYFGAELTEDASHRFADWCGRNAPGRGRVRMIPNG